MDRRDDYANWQDGGARGDRWAYGSERYEPEDDTRIPAPRSADPRQGPYGGARGPRSGEPMPPADPLYDPMPPVSPGYGRPPLQEPTGAVDASAIQRSISQTDGLYRSRKPIFMVLYGAVAVLGEILMLKPFFAGLFEIEGLAPLLAMIAFPMLAIGMYGLVTGAATAVQFQGSRVWLRTPLIYLPIALVLFVAAGTAVV